MQTANYIQTGYYNRFILIGKEKLNLQAMVYFSDHGESLDKSHNPDTFDFVMTHIPFWIYLSPQYRAEYPQTAKELSKTRTSILYK